MNWHEVIDTAERRGYFTDRQTSDASSWVTCACGQQDQRIPRRSDGAPKDRMLHKHGSEFFDAVLDGDFKEARRKLAVIEKRAAVVLGRLANELA